MKKIVYILAATMLSSSAAFAVAPRMKATASTSAMNAEKATFSRSHKMNHANAVQMRSAEQVKSLRNSKYNTVIADETTVDESSATKALYVPASGSFYLGLTPNFGMWSHSFGFTGINNLIGFNNVSTNATDYEWTYGYAVDYDDQTGLTYYDDQTSTDAILYMPLEPLNEYQAPILTANGASGKDVYQADIDAYFTGRDPLSWGFNRGAIDPETNQIPVEDNPGLTVYAHQITGFSSNPYFSYCTSDKTYYDANGVYTGWANYFRGSSNVKYSNWKLNAFACVVPPKPSSYLLEDIYADFAIASTEDVTITCNVYLLPTNDDEEMGAPIASGELSIAAGTFPSEDDALPIFPLVAYDNDGYETDNPVVIPAFQPLYVTIEGFNNPSVTQFLMGVLQGYTMSDKDFDFDVYQTMAPTHAYAQMDVDVQTSDMTEPVTMTTDAPCPSAYYTDDTKTEVETSTDFTMFFHAYFPVIANIDENSEDYGTANFEVTVPNEGGNTEVKVASDFDITSLLEEGLMQSAATEEWIKYEVTEVNGEDGLYTQVSINVEALPEGTNGRQGAIVFDGYASDFYIIVNQGDVAGISNVAAANGPVEYFDLQGRKLNNAPATGIYLQRQGNKTTKHIAK